MAAKFLCCLPLRLGVIIISFLQFLFCGAVAGFMWWALSFVVDQKNSSEISRTFKTTAIIVGLVYTIAALIGLLGFFGAIFKKNGFVKTFYILLTVVFGLQVASSIYYLITFYRTRSQSLADCIGDTHDINKIALCRSLDSFKRIPQGVMIASFIVPILLQAYACYVVHQYAKRLTERKEEKTRQFPAYVPPRPGPLYQPVSRNDESFPLTQPVSTYPYADATNSFGHQHSRSLDASHKV